MSEPSSGPISNQPLPRLPRLRAGLGLLAGDGETLVISPRLASMESIEDPEGVWGALLTACDGTAGLGAVRSRLARSGTHLSQDHLAEGVEALVNQGLLVDASADIEDRWSNQRAYIEQLTRGDLDVGTAHNRVRSTRVLVIGAGGTGTWLTLALTMMGVADLMVVDPDVVEERNRTRQPYPADSVGRRKVEVLGEILMGLRPDMRYSGVDLRVDQEDDLRSLVRDRDVVVCCADEPSLDAIAAIVASACLRVAVPHLICGYHGATGRIGPFWYPRRPALPCHGCLVRSNEGGVVPGSTGSSPPPRWRSPVSAAQAQLVGALAASEILHFRGGVHPATTGKVFALDSLTLDSRRRRVSLRGDCPICFGGRKRHVPVSSPAGV